MKNNFSSARFVGHCTFVCRFSNKLFYCSLSCKKLGSASTVLPGRNRENEISFPICVLVRLRDDLKLDGIIFGDAARQWE
jgi:hypothetical protein